MKKGFTLVELLAVIAILAILVIIALPNVMGMFNSAKKSTFVTELKKIYRGAEQAYIQDALNGSGNKYYAKNSSSNCSRKLDMSMRDELEYFIEVDSSGKVIKFLAHDDSYQFEYVGEMDINDIEEVEDVSTSTEEIEITCTSGDSNIKDTVTAFISGPELNIKMKELSGQIDPANDTVNESITAFKRSTERPADSIMNNEHKVSSSGQPIYMWYDSGTIYYYTEAESVAFDKDSSKTFDYMTKLSDISGLSDIDVSHVRNLKSFFYSCSEITSLEPLRNWNTKRVENLRVTFAGGKSGSTYYPNHITSLEPIKNWNTSRVTDMRAMFQGNVALESLEGLENWDTSHVTTMYGLFLGSEEYPMHIKSLKPLSKWNTSKVTDMKGMFQSNVLIESLEGLENWDTSNVTNMSWMFFAKDTSMSIKSLKPLSKWNTSKVTDMSDTFYNNSSLINLEGIENWNTSNVEDFSGMFNKCSSLVTANLSNWDMSKAKFYPGRTDADGDPNENGAKIFNRGCTSLTTIITPKAYSNVEGVKIILPKTFVTESGETYSELLNGSPMQTELRTSW